ncbi:MAG: hypothetical protein N2A42_02815 [Luteolibacter sp.]
MLIKWAFGHYDAEFTKWVVGLSGAITLARGVKTFSDGARVMGHIRVGSALGIFAWLLVSLF